MLTRTVDESVMVRNTIRKTLVAQTSDGLDADARDAVVDVGRIATEEAALSTHPRLLDWDEYQGVRL